MKCQAKMKYQFQSIVLKTEHSLFKQVIFIIGHFLKWEGGAWKNFRGFLRWTKGVTSPLIFKFYSKFSLNFLQISLKFRDLGQFCVKFCERNNFCFSPRINRRSNGKIQFTLIMEKLFDKIPKFGRWRKFLPAKEQKG